MAKKTISTGDDEKATPKVKPKSKRKGPSTARRTRYMALEPRVVFDGAIGAEIVDRVAPDTSAPQPDSSVPHEVPGAPPAVNIFATPEAEKAKAPAQTASYARDSQTLAANSAAPVGATDAQRESTQVTQPDTDRDLADTSSIGMTGQAAVQELLIIDGSVEGIDILKAAARSDLEIIILDTNRDGVQQISEILSSRTGVETVHIVSHGRPGEMTLGDTKLTLESMIARSAEIEEWSAHLDQGADLRLYGCEVAGGDRGETYGELLSRLTGADVAASTDNTGGSMQGGNWALETTVGDVQSSFFGDEALLTTAEILLPTTNLTSNAPWTTVFTGANYDFAGDMQAAGGADLIGSDAHGALYMNFDD